jgi:hypothetical protein
MEQQSLNNSMSVHNIAYFIFQAQFEIFCSGEKQDSFKILLIIDSVLYHLRSLMEIIIVIIPHANSISILQSLGYGVISTSILIIALVSLSKGTLGRWERERVGYSYQYIC